jgi:hypothetical protein
MLHAILGLAVFGALFAVMLSVSERRGPVRPPRYWIFTPEGRRRLNETYAATSLATPAVECQVAGIESSLRWHL